MKNLSMYYIMTMVVTTLILGLVYAVVQQNFRTGANDPQVQLATDIKNQLQSGRPLSLPASDSIDLSKSLASFVTLYDKDRKPVHSTGFLEGRYPTLPPGVLDFVKDHGEERVSWQPRHDIRMAMVVMSVHSQHVAFVAAGRSLKEIEVRESNLVHMIFIGWIAVMGVIVMAALVQFKYRNH